MVNQHQTVSKKETLAKWLSQISHTPLVAILVFTAISYYLLSWNEFLIINSVSVFFGSLLPILIILIWVKRKKIEMDIPAKEDRMYPLLTVILSYLIGVIILYSLNAPPIITVLMFCYFSIAIVVVLISHFWKISLHSMGMAGPATALIYVFGIPGIVFSLIVPPVMWSRVYLKKHTISQVIAGACLGFLLVTLQIYLLMIKKPI